LLDPARISSDRYFGRTKHADGKMAKYVKKDIAALSAEQQGLLRQAIAAVSAEAKLKAQRELDTRDDALIQEGRKVLAGDVLHCTECHQFRNKDEDATAPDLTGYGSREWLTGIIHSPKHTRFYGKRNDRMPAFGRRKNPGCRRHWVDCRLVARRLV
jgi:ubiquinol-cytochrome c reductase cytochrome b subunit